MYITTPIYYVNGAPHIGSCYTNFICDTLARFFKNTGEDVFFLTGTDEHGQKIQKSAQTHSPQAFVDSASLEFKKVFDELHISYDYFIRTTQKSHHVAVLHLWNAIKDFIYLGSYSGFYSVQDEAFYDAKEIVDQRAPSGAPVEWIEEPSYFFKLSAFGERLLEFYDKNPNFIQPESRKNEVIRFVEGGLQDLSISRTTFTWGIPVPNDPKHVIYVWLDALTNYITALGYPDTNSDLFQKFWPDATHMIGKDILRFHAIYWPAFLMAADLPLPKTIFAHGWWTHEGEKMSKSKGNVVDPLAMAEKYGSDALRYYLLREIPLGSDGDFSETALCNRYNNELANSFGNLVQRVFSFVHKSFESKVPNPIKLTESDHFFLEKFLTVYEEIKKLVCEKYALSRYAELFMSLCAHTNQYVDFEKPWLLQKNDQDRFKTVIYVLLEAIKRLVMIGEPLLPVTMEKIAQSMNFKKDIKTLIEPGQLINAFCALFPKILFGKK